MYFQVPDDERYHIDTSMDDRVVITGINVRISQNQVIQDKGKTKALIVRATVVEVDGHLRLPSGLLEIFARRVIAHSDAVLDVSGEVGSPDYSDRAPALSGSGPGEPGKPGDNGGNGSNGGKISIFAETIEGSIQLLAKGGNGGAAQSGGNGIKGTKGNDHDRCTPPTRGGPGGSAGSAGIPGKGGDGGDISLVVLSPLKSELIHAHVDPGTPGNPGQHGNAGEGGDGGKGGIVYSEREPCVPNLFNRKPMLICPPRPPRKLCELGNASEGPPGASFSNRPSISEAGNIGHLTIVNGQGDDIREDIEAKLACAASLLYLELALREAETLYANSDESNALDQLIWLGRLLVKRTVRRSLREMVYDAGLPNEISVNSDEFEALRTKTFLLIRRLSLGLDYWGNQRNFVPLVSYEFYSQALAYLLDHARIIETNYIKYRDSLNDWKEAKVHFELGIAKQEGLIAYLEDSLRNIGTLENALVREIELLTCAYEASWLRVKSTAEDFKNAVSRQSSCAFNDVAFAVGTIAVAIGTAGTGAATAMAAWQAYNDFDKKNHDPNDFFGDLAEPKYKIEKIIEIGNGIQGVSKGLSEIRDMLNPKGILPPELPNDAGKLLMQRKDIQATVEPFRHLPEAKAYLAEIDNFIELVTTRNSKLIEYNILSNSRTELLSDISKSSSEIGRLRQQVNRPNVQHLPEFVSFMSRANMLNKRVLMQLLYQEHRALEYWAGKRYPLTISRDSIDHLATIHAQTYLKLVDSIENRGREVQTFKFSDRLAHFSFKNEIGLICLNDFKNNGQAVFSIPYLPFTQMSMVRVTTVRISLPGIAIADRGLATSPFGLRLTHLGTALLRTVEGEVIEFSHEPRITHIFYQIEDSVTRGFSLGGSETYVKLTPEGPWCLEIQKQDKERVNLSGIDDIIIEFEGEFLPER
jgi:hypothetical protein